MAAHDPGGGSKKENIVLDGRIRGVLGEAAFDVQLENGHRLVGFLLKRDRSGEWPAVGERVRLDLSPFDMSKGRVLAGREEGGTENESEKFG